MRRTPCNVRVMKLLIEVRRYGKRNWAVYEGGELLAVTVYKKGAMAIVERLSRGALSVERRAA